MTLETILLWLLVGAVIALAVLMGMTRADISDLQERGPDISGRAIERLQEPTLTRKPARIAVGFCRPCMDANRLLWGTDDHYVGYPRILASATSDPACESCKRTYTVALTPVERRQKARGK